MVLDVFGLGWAQWNSQCVWLQDIAREDAFRMIRVLRRDIKWHDSRRDSVTWFERRRQRGTHNAHTAAVSSVKV